VRVEQKEFSLITGDDFVHAVTEQQAAVVDADLRLIDFRDSSVYRRQFRHRSAPFQSRIVDSFMTLLVSSASSYSP